MCQQFRFDNKSQFRVFLAKPQKAADLKLSLSGMSAGSGADCGGSCGASDGPLVQSLAEALLPIC